MRPLPSQNRSPRPWGPCRGWPHMHPEGTRYCATAPKITDPRTSIVLLFLDGHDAPARPPATGRDGLLVPSNGALPAFLPAGCMSRRVVYRYPVNHQWSYYLHPVGPLDSCHPVRLASSGLVCGAGRVAIQAQCSAVQCSVCGRLVSARQSEGQRVRSVARVALLPVNQHITGGGDRDKVRTKA